MELKTIISSKLWFSFFFLSLPNTASFAATLAESPLVKALIDGRATADLPQNPMYSAASDFIKSRTGSAGDITVIAYRILKFKSQPNCGRVAFGLYQASTNTLWDQSGGQMNICEDGTPPLRICGPSHQKNFVPWDAMCPDGSRPVDDPEVASAIADALRNGGVSPQEIQQRILSAQDKKKSGISKTEAK